MVRARPPDTAKHQNRDENEAVNCTHGPRLDASLHRRKAHSADGIDRRRMDVFFRRTAGLCYGVTGISGPVHAEPVTAAGSP